MIIKRFINIILLCFCSVNVASEAKFHFPTPLTDTQQFDIEQHINTDSLFSYQHNDKTMKGLFFPNMANVKRGVVIILPDINRPLLNNYGSSYLKDPLTDDGYDVYILQSLQLTDKQELIKESDNTLDSLEERLSNSSLDDFKADLTSVFNSVYSSLKIADHEKLIVMAHGITAGIFTEYLATLPNIKLHAFVPISAHIPNSSRAKHIAANLSVIKPAILDFTYTTSDPIITRQIAQRKRWVRKNQKFDYRHRTLFGLMDSPSQHLNIFKEMSGFFRRL